MNSHPLVQFPTELPSPSGPASHAAETDGERAGLLELRSESGTVYVSPTRWQRLRLRWIFRHFHVLPQQVLSPGDQRLIQKLSQSPTVTPPPPGSETIIGVIEKPRAKSTAPAHQVVIMTPRNSQPASRWVAPQNISAEREDASQGKLAASPRGSRRIADAPFRQWGALGMLAAVSAMVIVVRLYLAPSTFPVGTTTDMTASLQVIQTALRPVPRTLEIPAALQPTRPPAPLVAYERPQHWFAPGEPAPVAASHRSAPLLAASEPAVAESTSAALPTKSVAIVPFAAKPTLVSELPQGHFVSPVASDPNQVGELHLKALIAADGSVKDVTLVSGDPKLAEAGIRAVRRWHYNPDQASERETLIDMRFFGQDAVSVSSAAR
jgi:hypothetical protein